MWLMIFGDKGWGNQLAAAAVMTITVATCAFALGLIFGGFGAAAKLSRFSVLRLGGEFYTTVFRGVPDLLVIYLFFFGSSNTLMFVAYAFGHTGYLEVNPFIVGVAAVGIISGAYSTEVFRGAAQMVPKGEIEAAKAFGMGPWLLFRRIMMPQILRLALPGLSNVWVMALKETALISVTGLVEIMRQTNICAGSTKEPFMFYSIAALLYLFLVSVSILCFHKAEAYTNRGVRRA
ncbi:MAG: ABC transporter permease [Deltaproteobacteria bacterium]|nr:ABC transporter permease [Deltaproteobacteria bacterium]